MEATAEACTQVEGQLMNRSDSKSLLLMALVLISEAAAAQTYPAKPIRLVTSVAGGGPDFVSRLVAAGIAGGIGQNVVVDNRGNIKSGELVAQSQPDGYTLLVAAGSLWVGALMQQVPYDPVK